MEDAESDDDDGGGGGGGRCDSKMADRHGAMLSRSKVWYSGMERKALV
jgi:hypothetical protein